MNASGFIASRLHFRGGLVVTAVAISFFVMTVAVAVSSGYRKEIRAGISSVAGDIQITVPGQDFLSDAGGFHADSSLVVDLKASGGVTDVVPVLFRAGVVKGDDALQGILVKASEDNGLSGLDASIPDRLSSILGLQEGDDMLTYFIGDKLKVRKFKVSSIHESIVTSSDYPVVFVSDEALRRLNGWEDGRYSAVQLFLDSTAATPDAISERTMELAFKLDGRFSISSISQKYPELFSWLDLIDFNVFFIILLMTVVAGVNMISGLLIILFRNVSTIGMMKSMGMRDRSIASVFLRVSSRLVLQGMLAGNILAVAFCLIQNATHFIRLNPENYFLSFVPVHTDIPRLLVTDAVAYVGILVLMFLPTLFISRVDPASTIREQ